jgi:hypothetical protein
MRHVLKIAFIFAFQALLFIAAFNASARSIVASSCSLPHVQAAVNSASYGDTVVVPEGTCTWSSAISLSNNITLQGAGTSNPATIIKVNNMSTTMVQIKGQARVTNIKFLFEDTVNTHEAGIVRVSGKNWVIDNCHIEHGRGGYGIWAQSESAADSPAGLIQSCTFIDSRVLVNGVGNSFGAQHQEWYESDNLGSADAVYVENCTHTRNVTGNVIDGNRGGRYVFRYNTIYNSEVQAHAVQSTSNRGFRTWEVYGNSFISNRTDFYKRPVFLRSGTGVIFSNTVTGKWSASEMHLDSRRAYDAYPTICDGTQSMDKNVLNQNGWLCRDQPGAGKDVALTTNLGSHPNYNTQWKDQAHAPIYAWSNSYPIGTNGTSWIHIIENRDFYDSFGTLFNGTVGVGVGTLSNLPKQCTAGVGYWATDKGGDWNKTNNNLNDGALYKCVSKDTWALFYTPYEFPHPLKKGLVPITTITNPPPLISNENLAAPNNVRIK